MRRRLRVIRRHHDAGVHCRNGDSRFIAAIIGMID
jgi:hypothetical protein